MPAVSWPTYLFDVWGSSHSPSENSLDPIYWACNKNPSSLTNIKSQVFHRSASVSSQLRPVITSEVIRPVKLRSRNSAVFKASQPPVFGRWRLPSPQKSRRRANGRCNTPADKVYHSYAYGNFVTYEFGFTTGARQALHFEVGITRKRVTWGYGAISVMADKLTTLWCS